MNGKCILVIDDDPDFLAYVSIVLARHGYDVATAPDVGTGLDAARRLLPDLVIADVMISYGLTGAHLCHDLRHDPHLCRVPILMVSAILDDQDEPLYSSATASADAFMTKPLDPARLLAQVAAMLAQTPQGG
jgi:DNA-binding response OmpR family regulator